MTNVFAKTQLDRDSEVREMAEDKPQQPSFGSSPLMPMMIMLLMMVLLFDPNIRKAIGNALEPVMFPAFGFNYTLPMVTLLCAGFLTVTFSTIVRHFTTDWMKLAEMQKIQSSFNKERSEAMKANNQAKLKKLNEQQPEILKMNMQISSSQMRVMPITAVFAIPIFIWLSVFIYKLPVSTFSVPWASKVSLYGNDVCFFPNWIIVYFLFSLIFGQLLQRTLKRIALREKIAALPKEDEEFYR
jgi:uncharacterized membrane protein (DUF106 family)